MGLNNFDIFYSDPQWKQQLDHLRSHWLSAENSAHAELIKKNALRTVYCLKTSTGTFYVKHHQQSGFFQRVKQVLCGTPAQNEFNVSRYASKHGVDAVEIVAWAKGTGDFKGQSITVSPAIDDTITLSDMFKRLSVQGKGNESRRQELIASLARFIARSHESDFIHPDCHPGNILVREVGQGRLECLYVDLYGARCGKAVSDSQAAGNLAALHQWFDRRASAIQKIRFFKKYLDSRGITQARLIRRFAHKTSVSIVRHAFSLYAKRDRRIKGGNSYFAKVRLDCGYKGIVTLRYRNLTELLPVHPVERSQTQWRSYLADKFSHSSDNSVLCDDRDTETFFSTRFWTDFHRYSLSSPGWQRFKTAAIALNRDIPAVAGAAWVTGTTRGGIDFSTWFMLRPAGGEFLLQSLEGQNGHRRWALIDNVGKLIGRTVRKGLLVRNIDLNRINVLKSDDGAPCVYWMGIEGKATRRPVPDHMSFWMLTRLAKGVGGVPGITLSDQARFLRAFGKEVGKVRKKSDWRVLWVEIAGRINR